MRLTFLTCALLAATALAGGQASANTCQAEGISLSDEHAYRRILRVQSAWRDERRHRRARSRAPLVAARARARLPRDTPGAGLPAFVSVPARQSPLRRTCLHGLSVLCLFLLFGSTAVRAMRMMEILSVGEDHH